MKATIRIFSALMLCALAPMVITGCKPAGDDTSSTADSSSSVDADKIQWYQAEEALDITESSVEKAEAIVNAVDGWVAHFKSGNGFVTPDEFKGKTFNFNLKVITQEEEMNGEAEDFFNHSWDKNAATLGKLADMVKVPAFKEKDGFVHVSIGSSSTQGYYMHKGKAIGFGYLFGTGVLNPKAKSDEKTVAMKDFDVMMAGLKALGRPIVFTNSVAFAEYPGFVVPTEAEEPNVFEPMPVPYKNDQKFVETYPDDRAKVAKQPNTASMMANLIGEKVKALGLKDVYILKAGKKVKLQNKWTRTFIKELPEFKDAFGWMGDLGGKGFSIKLADKATRDLADDEDNLVWTDGKAGNDKKTKTDEYEQDPILNLLSDHPVNFKQVYEGTLDKTTGVGVYANIAKLIYEGVARSLEANKKSQGFTDQNEFHIWVGQTGKVRALYYKSKAIIKAAEEAAAKKKEEEKKSTFFFTPMKNELFANRNSSKLAA